MEQNFIRIVFLMGGITLVAIIFTIMMEEGTTLRQLISQFHSNRIIRM